MDILFKKIREEYGFEFEICFHVFANISCWHAKELIDQTEGAREPYQP